MQHLSMIANGARALRARLRRLHPYPVYRLIEPSMRAGEALLAARRHGRPARRLRIVGVTGTDGKTTTCSLIAAVLEAAGFKVGLSSSALEQLGSEPARHSRERTTPQPRELQRLLGEMVASGARWAVLEVSSHALALRRVFGLRFEVSVLTNISVEHLNFHRTIDRYTAAKTRLFRGHPQLAVLNRDEPLLPRFDRFDAGVKLYYGMSGAGEVRATDVEAAGWQTTFDLVTPIGTSPVRLQLPGKVNVMNALAAAAVGVGLRIGLAQIVEGLESVTAIPGRMERIDAGQDFTVVVDYAHTPVALTELYAFLRQTTRGRLIAVLGTEGGAYPGKRAPMGESAASACDFVVVTPTYAAWQAPDQIARELEVGVRRAGMELGTDYEIVLDRREAIRRAFAIATAGDVVAITGLGHRTFRSVRGRKEPWSDREVAEELLASEG